MCGSIALVGLEWEMMHFILTGLIKTFKKTYWHLSLQKKCSFKHIAHATGSFQYLHLSLIYCFEFTLQRWADKIVAKSEGLGQH